MYGYEWTDEYGIFRLTIDVSPIIGTVVESNANHYLVKTKQGLINMICKESGNEQTKK